MASEVGEEDSCLPFLGSVLIGLIFGSGFIGVAVLVVVARDAEATARASHSAIKCL